MQKYKQDTQIIFMISRLHSHTLSFISLDYLQVITAITLIYKDIHTIHMHQYTSNIMYLIIRLFFFDYFLSIFFLTYPLEDAHILGWTYIEET